MNIALVCTKKKHGISSLYLRYRYDVDAHILSFPFFQYCRERRDSTSYVLWQGHSKFVVSLVTNEALILRCKYASDYSTSVV